MMRAWVTGLLIGAAIAAVPEQIHTSWGEDSGSAVISWATSDESPGQVVQFGLVNQPLSQTASAESSHFRQLFNDTKLTKKCTHCLQEWLHSAKLSGLGSGLQYQYRVGSAAGWSQVFTISSKNESAAYAPTFAVFGDMGSTNSQSLPFLAKDVADGRVDGVLHVGDFAYDFHGDGGYVGQAFMRNIQNVSAKVPYFGCIGNHEGGTSFAGSLHHYIERFGKMMPGGDGRGIYYSFDAGPAHIIAFSSEAYFWQLWEVEQQFAWLKKDLAGVDRSKTPWIITMAHRPMYCSNADRDDCTKQDSVMRTGLPVLGHRLFALEPLFREHGVDLAFWAHEHSYERLWPVYDNNVLNGTSAPYSNPGATVHIVSGAAGCKEHHDAYAGPRGPWSAFRGEEYGYGRLTIANRTHLLWEQLEDTNGTVVDSVVIVKDGAAAAQQHSAGQVTSPEQQLAIFRNLQGCADHGRLPECAGREL